MAENLGSISRVMHGKLFIYIGENLPTTENEFKRFLRIIPLTPRDKSENKASAEDLLEAWQKRGGVGLGKYDELIRILQEADLPELVTIVKQKAEEIKSQLELEQRTENNPVADAPNPPDAFNHMDYHS